MSVLLLLPKVHGPGQLGKKGGAKPELLPEMELSADVSSRDSLFSYFTVYVLN